MTLDQISALDAAHFMPTFGKRAPVLFDHGTGSTLFDVNGKAYVDFLGGIATNVLGYAHPALSEAIKAQAEKGLHFSNLFYNAPQALLAQKLCTHTCADRVFFANSGAEANEGAIKLARSYFYHKGINKFRVVSALNSFHGRTLATVALTGQPKYQKPYLPLVPQAITNVAYNDFDALLQSISDETCAIMLELIQGEGGVMEIDQNYLQKVRSLCNEKGILLIFDEVQTGIGRTGTLFAHEQYGVLPDIFTSAKGLGGGVPIGAILARGEVAEGFAAGDHGTTFGGNPLACAAANAVLDVVLEGSFLADVRTKSLHLFEKSKALSKTHPCIKAIRGRGLLVGLELDAAIDGKALTLAALNAGFILNVAGHNTLRLAPPLIIATGEIDALFSFLDSYLP